MGRTIPSYRIATEMERNNWKIFRQGLGNKDICKRNNAYVGGFVVMVPWMHDVG
jgi:hypothetical protein